jgi:hypothetical protein
MPEKVIESMALHSPIGRAWENRKTLPTHGDTRINVGQDKCLHASDYVTKEDLVLASLTSETSLCLHNGVLDEGKFQALQ